jgi:glycosyltransferase involved in cell wall biosynthesis
MKKLLVTMPVYNEDRLLKRAVNSILDQTYDNFTLVIVNDGSTDNSLQEARKFLYDPRVIVLDNEVNCGAYYTKNVGFKYMESEEYDIYTVHDADDFSQPKRFEKAVKVFESSGSILSVQDLIVRFGNPAPKWHSEPYEEVPNIAHAFYEKRVFKSLGYFDNYPFNADEEYFKRFLAFCSLNNYSNYSINEVLYYAEITNDNMILKYGDDLRVPYRLKFLKNIEEMKKENSFYKPFFKKHEAVRWQ